MRSYTLKSKTYPLPTYLPDATMAVVRNLQPNQVSEAGIAGVVFLQEQIEREAEAALGEPARAAMAGRAAFGKQFWRRLALIKILCVGH